MSCSRKYNNYDSVQLTQESTGSVREGIVPGRNCGTFGKVKITSKRYQGFKP